MEAVQTMQSICDEMIEMADAMLHSRASNDKKGILANVHSTGQLLLELKRLNRTVQNEIESARAKVAENRQQVDAQRLRLDNLLYEQAHLTREIKRCKDLKTPEVQLVEAEIAEKLTANRFTDELPMINTTALQTLSEEQSARKAMQTELEEVDKTKSNLNQAIEEKMKFLSQLPAHLTAVEQSTAPLQAYFQSDMSATITKDSAALSLAEPLYMLYKHIEGYREAFGSDAGVSCDIVDCKPIRADFQQSEPLPKRQRTEEATDSAVPPQNLQDELAVSDKAVQITITSSCTRLPRNAVKSTVEATLLFQYLPALATVIVEVTQNNLPANVPFSSSALMLRIFPGDTGHQVLSISGRHSSVGRNAIPSSVPARPFMWAQWLCGIRCLPSVLPTETAFVMERSVQAIVYRLRRRLCMLSRLAHQLEILDKRAPLPVHPALAPLLPDAAVAEISIKSWAQNDFHPTDLFDPSGEGTHQEQELQHAGMPTVFPSQLEREGAAYYTIAINRLRPALVNLTAIIELPVEYPLRPPLFMLQGKTSTAFDNHVKMMETQLNTEWDQFLVLPSLKGYSEPPQGADNADAPVETDTDLLVDMLLSHQIRSLQTLFAAFAASASPEAEATNAMCLRPSRAGRNRRRAAAALTIYTTRKGL